MPKKCKFLAQNWSVNISAFSNHKLYLFFVIFTKRNTSHPQCPYDFNKRFWENAGGLLYTVVAGNRTLGYNFQLRTVNCSRPQSLLQFVFQVKESFKDVPMLSWLLEWRIIPCVPRFSLFFPFPSPLLFFFFLIILLFIYLWLCWAFVSVRGLSLVAASGGHSSSRCAGLSLSRPLLSWSTSSRRAGSVVVAHGPSCSAACGIFPDRGSNPCPLHWQADSQPLHHQGSPSPLLLSAAWIGDNCGKMKWRGKTREIRYN